MDPITLALAGFGGFMGAVQNRSKYQALVQQEQNLRQQARITKELGQFELYLFQRRAENERGAIPAVAAFSGFRTFEGSAFEVLMEQAREDATTAVQMRTARGLQAHGFETQARQARFAQTMLDRQLPLDMIGGALSFGSVAVRGGADVTAAEVAVQGRGGVQGGITGR